MRSPLARPSMTLYAALATPGPPPEGPTASGVRAVFLGTSTLLLRDARHTILIDGFFSRPPLWRLAARPIAPDERTIDACLTRAGVTKLDAVLCAHSHYDHALDAPVIARKYGARLYGSDSTVNIGRGYGLPQELLVEAGDGAVFAFGDFRVTFVHALHSPGDVAEGAVTEPLTPPAPYRAWKSGQCFSFFVRHPAGSLLVHPSANHVPGKLADFHADTAYLSVGRLGGQPPGWREEYWRETVTATDPATVLPIHWDDFTSPLTRPLRAMPYFMDDVAAALDFVEERCRRDRRTLVLPTAWQEVDPFGKWRLPEQPGSGVVAAVRVDGRTGLARRSGPGGRISDLAEVTRYTGRDIAAAVSSTERRRSGRFWAGWVTMTSSAAVEAAKSSR